MKSRSFLALLLCLNLTFYQTSLAQSGIAADGRTQTTVTTNGNVTGVTTNTVRGANGYNSFTTFNVENGKIVNLYLPGSTKNLFNLVNGSPTTISGILNSIKDGQIGGRVFFINPYGMVVGSTGVINVGALTVLTPSKNFNDSLIDANGNVSEDATNAVLAGTIPLTSDGLILVRGRINAIGDIRLTAGQIVNVGTIGTGAVLVAKKPDFSDVVNLKGLQTGTQIGTSNGDIVILAVNDFENSGTITTQGTNGVNGGNIDIRAGNDIRLIGNSLVSSSGGGTNSNAGKINIIADGNASLLDHAQVKADGGNVSGNGGAVEFSARHTLTIDGGNLTAGVSNGTAGSILLDPENDLVIRTSQNSGGADVTIEANNSITIGCATAGCNQGSSTVTISSQNLNTSGSPKGDSGDISITAPKITLLDNSQVLAGATGAYNAGDVTLTADATVESAIANADAGVTVGKATITGKNITFSAKAKATADGSSDGQSSTTLSDSDTQNESGSDSLGFSMDGVAASADISKAKASIDIGGATITAAGDVKLEAASESTAKASLTDSSIGVAFGRSDSTASVTVGTGAAITASGTVTIDAKVNNTLEVSASSKDASALSAAVAFGKGTSASTVQIDGNVTAGAISATSEVEKNEFSTEAKGTNESPTGGGSGAGIGVALAFYDSTATNKVTGTLTANTGDVTISASSKNEKNSIKSESSVGKNADVEKLKKDQKELDGLDKFLGDKDKQKNQPKEESNSSALGIAAAVSYVKSSNKAETNVSGSVTASGGNIKATSTATDSPGIAAAGSASDSTVGIGGAVALGNYSNSAETKISGNAVLDAKGVEIDATAEFTNPVVEAFNTIKKDFDLKAIDFSQTPDNWAQTLSDDVSGIYSGVKDIKSDLEDPSNLTTSYTNTGISASDSDNSVGIAGSVNLITLNNSATSAVAGNAKVTATTGDVKLSSDAKATMINVSGMAFTPDQLKDFNPGVKAGSSLGGSYLGANLTNASTAYIGDNTTVTASAPTGNVEVDAKTTSLAIDIVQSGDNAKKFGITGAFASNDINDTAKAYIQSNATVSAGKDVNVNATNTLNDFSIAGALGFGGTVQVGVTIAWNHLNQTTLAYIGDPDNTRTTICKGCGVTAGGKVGVKAQSEENLYAISFAAAAATGTSGKGADGESKEQPTGKEAPKNKDNSVTEKQPPPPKEPPKDGKSDITPNTSISQTELKKGDNGAGGGKYGFGISGDIAFNDATTSSGGPGVVTQAFINNGAKVTASRGDASLTAQDSSLTVAVGVAGAVGNNLALAGAYGQNTFNKETDAFTTNSSVNAKGLDLSASGNSDLINVTAGGSVNTQQGLALAGSVNNNSITNSTSAYVGDNTVATLGSDGANILAAQSGLVVSVAGAIGVATSGVGVGAAVDIGDFKDNVAARVDKNANIDSTGSVEITASNNEDLWPVAASLAIGNNFAADGSVVYEDVTNTTAATVDGKITTRGNLIVGSDDQTDVTNIAGGLAAGGKAAVSVSAIMPSVSRTTTATIGSTADVTALGSSAAPTDYNGTKVVGTLVQATSGGSLSDYAIGAAVAGNVSAAGAVIIDRFYSDRPYSLLVDTEASIATGAKVNSDNTGADAKQSVIVKASDGTGITDVAGALSGAGYGAAGVGYDQVKSKWTVNASIGKNATVKAAADVNVGSSLNKDVDSYAMAAAIAAGGSLAGAGTWMDEESNATASIDGTVNATGNVAVAADHHGRLNTVDGNFAAAAGAGFGLSASVITAKDTVDAFLGSNSRVTALGQGAAITVPVRGLDEDGNPVLSTSNSFHGITVSAVNDSSLTSTAVGAAVSGGFALDGSVIVNALTESTTAEIKSGAIVNGNNTGAADGQSVSVLASDKTDVNDLAGAVAFSISGGAGIGAAVDVGNIKKTTTAGIANGATVNAKGTVSVDALSNESIKSILAAVGISSGIGLAGTLGDYSDNPVSPKTTAYIGSCISATGCTSGATVSAGTVAVEATDSMTLDQTAGAAGGGSVAGVGAGILLVKNNADTQAYIGSLSNITSKGQTSVRASSSDSLTGTALTGTAAVIGVAVGDTEAKLIDNSSSAAFIADEAVVTSSGDVDVAAANTRTISTTAAGLSVGLIAGSASSADVTFNGGATAYVGDANVTSQTGTLDIIANLKDTGTAAAYGIGAGVGAGTATLPSVTDNANTDAHASGGAVLWSAGTTKIDAEANRTLTATSGSVTAGGVAVGASIANVILGGKTRAYTESGVQIGTSESAVGGLVVKANEVDTGNATATPMGGGVLSGIGGETNVNLTPNVSASLTGADVHAKGDVSVNAAATGTVNSKVVQKTFAGGITVGWSDANGSVTPTVSAAIGGGAVQAGSILVDAEANQNVTVESIASSGFSFASGMYINADANATSKVTASVGGGADLDATGEIQVLANSKNSIPSLVAGATSPALSVASGGSATANAYIDNDTEVTIGEATIASSAGNLTVKGSSDNSIGATSTTRSGSGLVNVGGATTNAKVVDTVSTTLASGADLDATAGKVVVASSGSENVDASSSNPNGLSGVAQSEAATNVTITTNVKTKLQDGADVNGDDTTIESTIANLDANPNSGASSYAYAAGVLGVGAYATSILNTTANSGVDISGGATVAGNSKLTLQAGFGSTNLANSATARAEAGIVPISEATAINNATLGATVNVAPGTNLLSNLLTVNALKPTGADFRYSNTASARYTFYAIFGIPISGNGTRNVGGIVSNNNLINLNGILRQPGGQPALVVNADGSYTGRAGVVGGEDANNIVLNDITGSNSTQAVVLSAPGGKVQGSLQVNANLLLVNNSDRNLVIQDISAQGGGHANVEITGDGSAFTSTIGPMPITIQNNGASNVVFTGDITDAGGSLAVTNQGGSILGTQGNAIQVSSANLLASSGGIGSAGGEIACLTAGCPGADLQLSALNLLLNTTLEPVTGTLSPGQLSAVARNDINLNLTADATSLTALPAGTSAVPVQLNRIVAGGDVNLTLNSGVLGNGQAPVDSEYQIRSGDWAGAGGLFNIILNGTEGASPTLTVDGTLTSGFDKVSVTANADGTFTSLVGAAGQGSAELNYAHAGGGSVQVGDIDTSRSGISITGTGNVAGTGTIAVLNGGSDITVANHTEQMLTLGAISSGAAGTVNIAPTVGASLASATYGSSTGRIDVSSDSTSISLQGQLSDPNGTISVTSGANITGASGTALIQSKNIELAAGGSIGPDLGVQMTQPSGVLNARASGSIGLTATGDINIGSVSSRTADVSISSTGSILSADSMYQPNIAARNVTLIADGTIGSSEAWLSTLAAGTLDASAGSDIYLRQISGDLNSESMISRDGGINIIIDKGDGYLQQVRAPKNVLLLVNGNVLNIGVIDSDKIKIMLAGKGGVATIDEMLVGTSVDFVADISHILRLIHTGRTNPLLIDITTTEGGYNLRPIGPGIILTNSLANAERRERERRFGLKNRAEPPENYVIDKTSKTAEPGVGQ